MVEKNRVTGAIEVSEVIGGYLVRKIYIGYTKKEAVKLFKEEVRNVKNNTVRQ